MTNWVTDPPLTVALTLENESKRMFAGAAAGVAFTGCCDFTTGKIYLHPLVALREGNVNIDPIRSDAHSKSAGALEGVKFGIKSHEPLQGVVPSKVNPRPADGVFFHPNMTQTARAASGEKAGHEQICAKHALNKDVCLGFAVTKGLGNSGSMTTSSQTLNSDKIKGPLKPGFEKLSPGLQKTFHKNQLGTGVLTKDWAQRIATAIELSFVRSGSNVTPGGSYESPI
jgi:hypothetical protein